MALFRIYVRGESEHAVELCRERINPGSQRGSVALFPFSPHDLCSLMLPLVPLISADIFVH